MITKRTKAQPRGISRSMPRKKTGLASSTKKRYIKSTCHCLILCQNIVGDSTPLFPKVNLRNRKRELFIDKIRKKGYNGG